MNNPKLKNKFTYYDMWITPPTFQQLCDFGLIGRRIGEVNIIDYHDNPGDSFIDDGIICQVKNCINDRNKPLEILLFSNAVADYSKFVNQLVIADAGNFYCPGWQEIPTYQVKGLRIAGDEK